MKFIKSVFLALFLIPVMVGCSKNLEAEVLEQTVEMSWSKRVLIEYSHGITICFTGFADADTLSFQFNCGYPNSYQIFMSKDNFPYRFYFWRGDHMDIYLIEASPKSVKLRFTYEE